MTDVRMNLEVLNLGISTLLTCITLTDEQVAQDGTLRAYLPPLRSVVRELQGFEGVYRHDGVADEEKTRTTDEAGAHLSREALIHARVKQYPVVPLMESDSPEQTLRLISCTSSLLEFIIWLNRQPGSTTALRSYLPDLVDIAGEAMRILRPSVMNVISDITEKPDEPMTGVELVENTDRLARLSVALTACLREITRRNVRGVSVLTDDLYELALQLSMAFRTSARMALPVEPGFL